MEGAFSHLQRVTMWLPQPPPDYQSLTVACACGFALLVVVFWESLSALRRLFVQQRWQKVASTPGFSLRGAGLPGDNRQDAADIFNEVDDGILNLPFGERTAAVIEQLLGKADPSLPEIEGVMSSPKDPYIYSKNRCAGFPFDNENASGFAYEMHKPTYDPALMKSGNYPNGSYLKAKKRIWESRIQIRFKRPPRNVDFYFGVELDAYVPLNSATKRAQRMLVGMIRSVVGNKVYHSPGDDPKVARGELERPVFTMPLYAFDQYIVTPPGELAPDITDPKIETMGKKRFKRVREFKAEVDALEFKVGYTYTFCFWGISQFMDKLKWEVQGVPLISPFCFNKFCGRPPLRLVMYSLDVGDSNETRHLQSRKRYFVDMLFWSSRKRPTNDELCKYFNLEVGATDQNGIQKSKIRWWQCCSAR